MLKNIFQDKLVSLKYKILVCFNHLFAILPTYMGEGGGGHTSLIVTCSGADGHTSFYVDIWFKGGNGHTTLILTFEEEKTDRKSSQ